MARTAQFHRPPPPPVGEEKEVAPGEFDAPEFEEDPDPDAGLSGAFKSTTAVQSSIIA